MGGTCSRARVCLMITLSFAHSLFRLLSRHATYLSRVLCTSSEPQPPRLRDPDALATIYSCSSSSKSSLYHLTLLLEFPAFSSYRLGAHFISSSLLPPSLSTIHASIPWFYEATPRLNSAKLGISRLQASSSADIAHTSYSDFLQGACLAEEECATFE